MNPCLYEDDYGGIYGEVAKRWEKPSDNFSFLNLISRLRFFRDTSSPFILIRCWFWKEIYWFDFFCVTIYLYFCVLRITITFKIVTWREIIYREYLKSPPFVSFATSTLISGKRREILRGWKNTRNSWQRRFYSKRFVGNVKVIWPRSCPIIQLFVRAQNVLFHFVTLNE